MDAPNGTLKLLHKGEENQRRHRIIDAGRSQDDRGTLATFRRLLILLDSANDEMLGGVVHSLGELKVREAVARIKSLVGHDVAWVSQNATWALHQFSDTTQ